MFTTDDLILQVRDQIQETNTTPISDTTILNALNRGNSYAWDIYSRHYPEPLIVRTTATLNADGKTFDIPNDAFEQRLQKVELSQGGISYSIERMNYRRTTPYRNNVVGSRPAYYTIRERKVELLPAPAGSANVFDYTMYYVRRPDTLRKQLGQVSSFAVAGVDDANIVVDTVGSTLSASDPYNKYVNFVNSHTGEIRGSAEIKTISGNQITFKQTPTRSTVLGRTISGDIPSDLEVDDLITDIRGSCVVFLQQPTTNFLIQYAVSEIRRALGYDTGLENNILKNFEKQIESTWAGREASLKIKSTNRIWKK
jgi:hypothetical protein